MIAQGVNNTQDNSGLEDGDIENHYHLLGEDESSQLNQDNERESDYHLLGEEEEEGNKEGEGEERESDYYLLSNVSAEDETKGETGEAIYHVPEMMGDDDNDYEDPDDGNLFLSSVHKGNVRGRPTADYEVPRTKINNSNIRIL